MAATGISWNKPDYERLVGQLVNQGRSDVVGFGLNGVWVARGDGDGAFATPKLACTGFGANGSWHAAKHPRLLGDLSGRLDLVGFGDDGVWTALGNGDGSFQ